MEEDGRRTCLLYNVPDLVSYLDGLNWQRALQRERIAHKIEHKGLPPYFLPDALVLLEHPVVYTLGSSSEFSDILFSLKSEDLTEVGDSVHVPGQDGSDAFDIHRVQRGGKVTYHCPGQIVGYPIVDLARHTKVCVAVGVCVVFAWVCVCGWVWVWVWVCECVYAGYHIVDLARHTKVCLPPLPPSPSLPRAPLGPFLHAETHINIHTHTHTHTHSSAQTHTQDIEWYLRTLEKVIINVLRPTALKPVLLLEFVLLLECALFLECGMTL
jgi:lipoate-protein ligase B